jgi:Phytanoyl-CoA dioxygenase (PhyH)
MDSRQKIAKPVRLENNRLDEAHIATLCKQGFSSFENVALAAEVSEIRSICAKLIFERTGEDEGAFFDFVGDAPLETKGLTQLLMPSDYDPKLRRMDYQKRLNALAKQILGPRARFAGDHLFYKPPVAGPSTPWHQDEAFLDPKFEYEEVSFWLPLQPATVENGCLRFIPGSHLTDIQPHRKIQGKERAHGIECLRGFLPTMQFCVPFPWAVARSIWAGPCMAPDPIAPRWRVSRMS